MKKIIACVLMVVAVFTICACSQKNYDETIDIDNENVKMIAHRGLSGLAIENTEKAFILAGEHSYFGIEADVRRTADGKFVMCHDDNLERIAGRDMLVEKTNLEDLLSVPLIPKKEGDEITYLTTLDRYIDLCKQYDKQAVLELKSNFNEEEVAEIIAIVSERGYLERVTFISFFYDSLLHVRKALPNQPVMFLFSEMSDEITEKLISDRIDVAVYHKELTKKAIETFHDAGLEVNCWTVDGEGRAESLIEMGVDYVTTNILE